MKHNKKISVMDRIIRCCTKYEVIFRTVVMCALTFASVLVGVASWKTSNNQLELNQAIVEQDNKQKMPHLVTELTKCSDDFCYYNIINKGGELRETSFSINENAILQVSYFVNNKEKKLYYRVSLDKYLEPLFESVRNEMPYTIKVPRNEDNGNVVNSYLLELEMTNALQGYEEYTPFQCELYLLADFNYYDFKNEYHNETLRITANDMYKTLANDIAKYKETDLATELPNIYAWYVFQVNDYKSNFKSFIMSDIENSN